MKKLLKTLVFALVFVVTFSFHAGAVQRKLIVGVSADYPPFVYIKRGKIVGFDIDLIKRIAKSLNYKVQFQDMEFINLFPALKTKKIDLAISAISVTKKRDEEVYFSSQYYFPKFTILYTKDNKIDSIEKLTGKTVAAVSGTVMEDFLLEKFASGKKIKTKIFTNSHHVLYTLLKGRVDAVLAEDGWAKANVKIYNNLSYFIFDSSPQKGYAIAFYKDSPLVDKFNDELLAIKASEEFWTLKKKWGLI